MSSLDEKQWILLSHLGTLIGYIIPFGNVVVPLLVYSMKKESPLIQEHSRNSLNFQISITIYMVISFILVFILIGVALIFILALVQLICVIIATIKADRGELYRYPITIQFVKD